MGTDPDAIVKNVQELLQDTDLYSKMAGGVNPFGDGKASGRICTVIQDLLATFEGLRGRKSAER